MAECIFNWITQSVLFLFVYLFFFWVDWAWFHRLICTQAQRSVGSVIEILKERTEKQNPIQPEAISKKSFCVDDADFIIQTKKQTKNVYQQILEVWMTPEMASPHLILWNSLNKKLYIVACNSHLRLKMAYNKCICCVCVGRGHICFIRCIILGKYAKKRSVIQIHYRHDIEYKVHTYW